MAIQMRRGLYADFDPTRMLPGEWAVSIDSDTKKQIVWMCFQPGTVKRMGLFEDLESELDPYKEYCAAKVTEAQGYANQSKEYSEDSLESSSKASASEQNAKISEGLADSSKTESNNYAMLSHSYSSGGTGTRTGEDTDNAYYYLQQVREIVKSIGNPLTPKGTTAFENLPSLDTVEIGWMYNISNDFVTDDRFVDGAGQTYKAGNNVYCVEISDTKMWDILAGQSYVIVDDVLSSTSENPVMNKVIYDALQNVADNIVELDTYADWEALPSSKYNDDKIYVIKESFETSLDADEIPFTSTTGLTSTRLGNAVDEVNTNLKAVTNKLLNITLAWDNKLVGYIVTLENGNEAYSFTADDTLAKTIYAEKLGTWTVTESFRSTSDTFTATYYGNYVYTIKSGFSISYWAGKGNVTATKISDISETDMRKLMTLHTCADYLVEECTYDSAVIDDFVANDIAMKWIGLRDYVCDKLMAIADVETKLLTSDYWEKILKDHVPLMTSNSAPYGISSASVTLASSNYAYFAFDGSNSTQVIPSTTTLQDYGVDYKFVYPIRVLRASVITNEVLTVGYIEGSNDGLTWTVISNSFGGKTGNPSTYDVDLSSNENYYLYYRFHSSTTTGNRCNVRSLQFYGRSLNVSVPNMTSNIAPWGEASASTSYSEAYLPYKAFTSSTSEAWDPADADTFGTAYVTFDFKKPTVVKIFLACQIVSSGYNFTKNLNVYGYNDDSDLTLLASDVTTGVSTTGGTINYTVNSINNSKPFTHYKVVIMSASAYSINAGLGLKYQFYGVDYSEREFANGSTMNYLYDHGVELPTFEIVNGIPNSTAKSSVTKEADDLLYVDEGGTTSWLLGTSWDISNLVDFTEYSLFRANINMLILTSGWGGFFAMKEATTSGTTQADISNYFSDNKLFSIGTTSYVDTLYVDISSVSDSGYITLVNVYSNSWASTIEINEIWLE